MTAPKPATSLPWGLEKHRGTVGVIGPGDSIVCDNDKHYPSPVLVEDAAYIVHAANHYPQLVAALRAVIDADSTHGAWINLTCENAKAAQSLLRSLGEL